jgi:hypothetical protein
MSYIDTTKQFCLEQQDFEPYDYYEAHKHYTMCDAAHVIDQFGVIDFLRGVTPLMKHPQEQHVLTQLLLIAEKYEHVLLKMDRADRVLYEVKRGE